MSRNMVTEKGYFPVQDMSEAWDALCFQNIHSLLRLLATFAVGADTAERSFLSLQRLKTWLRSRIDEIKSKNLLYSTLILI